MKREKEQRFERENVLSGISREWKGGMYKRNVELRRWKGGERVGYKKLQRKRKYFRKM